MAEVYSIEVVRGRLTDARAESIVAFWARHGALGGDAARARVREVVCVVLDGDGDGEVVGVCSAYDAAVAMIGNRRFWVYRRFVAPGVPEVEDVRLLNAAFDELESTFTGAPPLGLCVVIDDRELMRRHPEAVDPATELVHAGYADDGSQVRVRYFDDARIY